LIRRQSSRAIFRDTPNVIEKKAIDQSQNLKGLEILSDALQLELDSLNAIKASKRDTIDIIKQKAQVEELLTDKSANSCEGDGISLEVSDKSKGKSAVLDEEDWGFDDDETFLSHEEDIKELEIEWVSTNDNEAKDDNDIEDDKSIDI
nr:hypothetical protein [Tanacetum cinerariifolium]